MRRAKCKSLALASSIESNVLELCKAVLHCQNLDKLCIRSGDFIRFLLDATAPKLNMVSGNKINFQFVWEFSCEKWEPAQKMAKSIYGERTLIFKDVEELGNPGGKAHVVGFKRPQVVDLCACVTALQTIYEGSR